MKRLKLFLFTVLFCAHYQSQASQPNAAFVPKSIDLGRKIAIEHFQACEKNARENRSSTMRCLNRAIQISEKQVETLEIKTMHCKDSRKAKAQLPMKAEKLESVISSRLANLRAAESMQQNAEQQTARARFPANEGALSSIRANRLARLSTLAIYYLNLKPLADRVCAP